jgi:hypothetical protein
MSMRALAVHAHSGFSCAFNQASMAVQPGVGPPKQPALHAVTVFSNVCNKLYVQPNACTQNTVVPAHTGSASHTACAFKYQYIHYSMAAKPAHSC